MTTQSAPTTNTEFMRTARLRHEKSQGPWPETGAVCLECWQRWPCDFVRLSEILPAALEQAHDRLDKVFGLVYRDMTDDDIHGARQEAWFGMDEISRLLYGVGEAQNVKRE